MSVTYYGDGTQPSLVSSVAGVKVPILSSTNATPIVVQTASPHGFTTGSATDTVEIEGHLVNTAANGVWQITTVDATHFQLNTSIGNGVGAATGYAIDYSVNPATSIMADGTDMLDAAHLNLPAENLANMVPWMNRRVGKYRLYDIYITSSSSSVVYASLAAVGGNPFTLVPGAGALFSFASDPHAPILGVSDILFVSYVGGAASTAVTGSTPSLGACLGLQAYGAGAYTPDLAAQGTWTPQGALSTPAVTLNSVFFGGSLERFDIGVMAAITNGIGTATIQLLSPYRITAFHYRQN